MSNEERLMHSPTTSLRVKRTILNKLNQKAKELGVSKAKIMNTLLKKYLSGEIILPDNLMK